jgi:drug/metabolite transporter (DMT)-like permease
LFARVALLFFGVFVCSTSVIFIKASAIPPLALASLRLLAASFFLFPIYLRDFRRYGSIRPAQYLKASMLPGFFLALHFITWNIGARLTTAANSSLIVNLVPIVMPFFLYGYAHEKLSILEWIATGFAICGLILMGSGDFRIGAAYFRGDVTCFVSMLFLTCYLALGRRNRNIPSIWLYLVPLYCFGGLFCATASLALEPVLQTPYRLREVFFVLAITLGPTITGHTILNYSMKHLRGQIVGIIVMTQFVYAGILAFFLFDERPHWTFYPSSLVLLLSAWLAIAGHRRQKEQQT